MKLCDTCGKAPAEMLVKLAVDNKITSAHLCRACAAAKGVPPSAFEGLFNGAELPGGISGYFGDFLPAQRRALACPACGLRYAQFREAGRLGCAACYESFAPQLAELMQRIHGASRHTGRAYASAGRGRAGAAARERRAAELRAAVKAAVAREDFEAAAGLRDELKALEGRDG
jgi:protein arginine kinase activator